MNGRRLVEVFAFFGSIIEASRGYYLVYDVIHGDLNVSFNLILIILSIFVAVGIFSYWIFKFFTIYLSYIRYIAIEKQFCSFASTNAIADKQIFDKLFLAPMRIISTHRETVEENVNLILSGEQDIKLLCQQTLSSLQRSRDQTAVTLTHASEHIQSHVRTLVNGLSAIQKICTGDRRCEVSVLLFGEKVTQGSDMGKHLLGCMANADDHMAERATNAQFVEDDSIIHELFSKSLPRNAGPVRIGDRAKWALAVSILDLPSLNSEDSLGVVYMTSKSKRIIGDRCVSYAEQFSWRMATMLYRVNAIAQESSR